LRPKKNDEKSKSQESIASKSAEKKEPIVNEKFESDEDEDEQDDDDDDENNDADGNGKPVKGLKELLAEQKKITLAEMKKQKESQNESVEPADMTKLSKSKLKEKTKESESEKKTAVPARQGLKELLAEKKQGKLGDMKKQQENEESKSEDEEEDEEDDNKNNVAKAYKDHIENQEADDNNKESKLKNMMPSILKNKLALKQKEKRRDSDVSWSENDAEELDERPVQSDQIKRQEKRAVEEYEKGDKFRVISDFIPEVEDDLQVEKDEIVEFVGLW
jgi:hypothetical protein